MRDRRRASFTANVACAARAHGALHPDAKLRNPDHLAHHFVTMPLSMLLLPLLRRRFIPEFEKRGPGIYYHHQARTHVLDALVGRELGDGARQLVLLGAGFDTRAHRIAQAARVFEVDHPLTSAEKQRRVARFVTAPPAHVTYVPVDFTREALGARLAAGGFDPSLRTIFLWEGVTMYLTEAAVHDTLALIARTAEGSVVGFDYVHATPLAQPPPDFAKTLALAASYGEPYQFGVDHADLPALLARHDMTVVDNLDAATLAARYLTGSDGRPWGYPPDTLSLAIARVSRRSSR